MSSLNMQPPRDVTIQDQTELKKQKSPPSAKSFTDLCIMLSQSGVAALFVCNLRKISVLLTHKYLNIKFWVPHIFSDRTKALKTNMQLFPSFSNTKIKWGFRSLSQISVNIFIWISSLIILESRRLSFLVAQ